MSAPLDVSPEVAAAVAESRPVVALETSVLAQGLPPPHNAEVVAAMQARIREEGAVPALVAVVRGRPTVGLDAAVVERFAAGDGIAKAGRRDLAPLAAAGADGATTVSATMAIAAIAGIELFATGGIGGVHRGADETFDVSADLGELARTPVTVVASGAKSILDLPKTLEVLESLGVPVVGFRTGVFPGFHFRDSGLALEATVAGADEAARLVATHRALGGAGLLIANPAPAAHALPRGEVEAWIEAALAEAARRGVAGKAVTPFLLERIAESSAGRTIVVNRALLIDNAGVAARIAGALAARRPQAGSRGGIVPPQ